MLDEMNEMMGPIIMASQEFTTAESSDFGAQQKIIVIQLQKEKKQKLEGVSLLLVAATGLATA